MKRRHFISATTMGLGAVTTGTAIDYAKPIPEAEGLTVYQNGKNILVRIDNLPALGYRAHESLKYPCLAPLSAPISGLLLTTESALPYPHHRSLKSLADSATG